MAVSVAAELEEARSQAIATGQASAAVQATMGKAKVDGSIPFTSSTLSAGSADTFCASEEVFFLMPMSESVGEVPVRPVDRFFLG